jgi:CDP-paratose synthetase
MTGGTGFLGSHLLEKILSNNISVVLIKRSHSSLINIEEYIGNPLLKIYNIDLVDIKNVFNENKIDVIIHTATDYGRNGFLTEVLNSNLIFPLSIIQEAIKHKVPYFINTDTFFNKGDLKYSHLINYSISKKLFLESIKEISSDIKIINMRIEHMFGERDSMNKFVPKIINKLINNEASIQLTDGFQKRDFIYIKDVVEAFYFVLKSITVSSTPNFQTYDVGLGTSMSIRDFSSTLKEKINSSSFLDFGAIPTKKDEIMDSFANNEELKSLGWIPLYTVEEAIDDLLKQDKNKSINHYG